MRRAAKNYRIDRNRHVAERFEEETVIVNVESGYYYSLSPSGAEILELLDEGITADNLATALFADSEKRARFRSGIADFVDQLAAEGIIVESDSDGAAGTPAGFRHDPPDAGYQLPVLERFDDVRDLLLIDPVHQVDPEYGWPKKPNSESQLEPRM